jgi:hypothetical protein
MRIPLLLLLLLLSASTYAQDSLTIKAKSALSRTEAFFMSNPPAAEDVCMMAVVVRNYPECFSKGFRNWFDSLAEVTVRTPMKIPLWEPFKILIDGKEHWNDTVLGKLKSGIDKATLNAMYCNRVPLADTFLLQMQRSQLAGKYKATHVSMAMAAAVEKHGIDPTSKAAREVLSAQPEVLLNLIQKKPFITDLEVESAAFLSLYQRKAPTDWYLKLLKIQRSDGGWPNHEQSPVFSTHTSTLMLWVLCDLTSKGKVIAFF